MANGIVNFAGAFAPKVAESFHKESVTDSARGTGFSFSGVRSVKVMSVDTVPLNDYQRSGTNRYGTPPELGDTVQELVMGDDKAFTFTIDKGNQADQLNLKGATKAMRRQIEQVVVPWPTSSRPAARWTTTWSPPPAGPCSSPTPTTRCCSSPTTSWGWTSWGKSI